MAIDLNCKIVILSFIIASTTVAEPGGNQNVDYNSQELYNDSSEFLCYHDSDCYPNERCSFVGKKSFECICDIGYERNPTNCVMKNCSIETKICDENAVCKYDSISKRYGCSCKPNFYGNGFECLPETQESFLLINQDTKTLKIPLLSLSTEKGIPINDVNVNDSVVGVIDIDCVEGKAYSTASNFGSNEVDHQFTITKMSYNGSDVEPFINDFGCPEGIAIDWISRNVFWTDKTRKRIEVASLVTKKRNVLIDEKSGNPAGIAVHPGRGKIFWAESNLISPEIKWANEDGSEIGVFNEHEVMGIPVALTIDWDADNLCWTDIHTRSIYCQDINRKRGSRKMISTQSHPFLLTFSPEYFYWTEFKSSRVEIVKKKSGLRLAIYPGGVAEPSGIVAVPKQCPAGITNVCQYNNGGCNRNKLCLPRGTKGRTCV